MIQPKDSIYANPLSNIEAFKFDEKPAEYYLDMIHLSVSGYSDFKITQKRSTEAWLQHFNLASVPALK